MQEDIYLLSVSCGLRWVWTTSTVEWRNTTNFIVVASSNLNRGRGLFEADLQSIVFLSIAQSNSNSAEVLHYRNIQ